jgi:sigma-54-specific transcriptional regulator
VQDALIFEDPASRALLGRVKQIARGDVHVVITGEPGSGKSALARAIHAYSPRQHRELGIIDCADAPGEEIERRFAAGAEKAGGTLVLDNITALPLAAQRRFTHLLSTRPAERAGGAPTPEVRIIATSRVPLDAVVRAERFRGDLYHRLSVAAVDVPPLRQRPDDLVPLARRILERLRLRRGCGPASLSEDAIALLRARAWPENIRELERLLRSVGLTCPGREIAATDLPWPLARGPSEEPPDWEALARALRSIFRLSMADLDRWVHQTTVRLAYLYCQRSLLETARLLGLSRNVLRARLVDMGELDGGRRP